MRSIPKMQTAYKVLRLITNNCNNIFGQLLHEPSGRCVNFLSALIASFGRELASDRDAALTLHALATFATRYLLLASRWMEWRWHVAIAVQQQCQRAHFKIDYWWQKFVLRVKCCKNVLLFSNFECRTTTHSPNDRTIVKCSNIMS